MFVFGHLGIGSKLASPWSRGLSYGLVLLGTALPDMIDKPLYYGLSFLTGKVRGDLGLISSTRTLGHTGLFLLALTSIAYFRKSKVFAAVAIGVATHLLLDNVADRILMRPIEISSALQALAFPLLGAHFSVMPFNTAVEHLQSLSQPLIWVTEALGLACLTWDEWKRRHISEIARNLHASVRRMRRDRESELL